MAGRSPQQSDAVGQPEQHGQWCCRRERVGHEPRCHCGITTEPLDRRGAKGAMASVEVAAVHAVQHPVRGSREYNTVVLIGVIADDQWGDERAPGVSDEDEWNVGSFSLTDDSRELVDRGDRRAQTTRSEFAELRGIPTVLCEPGLAVSAVVIGPHRVAAGVED